MSSPDHLIYIIIPSSTWPNEWHCPVRSACHAKPGRRDVQFSSAVTPCNNCTDTDTKPHPARSSTQYGSWRRCSQSAGHSLFEPRVSHVVASRRHANLTQYSVYSAYEHSLLPTSSQPLPPSRFIPRILDPKVNLPPDITLETVLSIFLLCVGVVLSSQELKPIQWNVWAGRLERSKDARAIKEFGVGGGNPYATLEDRPGFLDIRGQRKEFAKWVKEGER